MSDALGDLNCPACNRKVSEHEQSDYRKCSIRLLKRIGKIPEDVCEDHIEIIASDGEEMPPEVVSLLRGMVTRKDSENKRPSADDLKDSMKDMLQNLLDTKFKERPDHPDYWAMNQIILGLDTDAESVESFEEFIDHIIQR